MINGSIRHQWGGFDNNSVNAIQDNVPSADYQQRVEAGQKTLSECIIAGGNLNGNFVIMKNRARMYNPKVVIIRELTVEGLEVVYMMDLGFQEYQKRQFDIYHD